MAWTTGFTPAPDGFGHLTLRETLDVPVLARVNGYALGGGLELVVGLRLGGGLGERRAGLRGAAAGPVCPSTAGSCRWRRQLPAKWAMEVLLTGRRFSAAEALALGLLNEVVPAADLDAAVDRWLENLLACAPLSLRAIKQIVRRTAHMTAADARMANLPALIEVLNSDDGEEGVRAFTEKRPPRWQGQ